MAAQPDHILYPQFTNASDYSGGSNTMRYFYRSGSIHIENGVNKDEFKAINYPDNTGRNRTTKIKDRTDALTSPYRTPGGTDIEFESSDELWVNHNYVGNNDINRPVSSIEDSWWYDVEAHREYRVYLVVGYNNSRIVAGTRYFDWRVKKAIIEYNDAVQDTTQGTFQFTSKPPGPVDISGSVTITSHNTQPSYRDFTLKLYQDSTLLEEQDIAMSFAGGSPITINVNTKVFPGTINPGDRISLALEAGSKNSSATSDVVVTNYELEINGVGGESTERTPVLLGIEGDIELSDDCNALLNNISTGRGNDKLQVVEFELNELGNGISHPSNIPEILANDAVKAQIPESFFTQAGPIRGKYRGSKATRDKINSLISPYDGHLDQTDYTRDEDDLFSTITENTFPIVDIRDINIGYFNQIIDPYPVLNGKTAYFIKYLINANNTVQDPSVSEIGNINFLNTFRPKDVNNETATYLPSVPNDVNAEELLDLRERSTIFKVGEFPYPILWSQTSATTYTENLPLTGSQNFYSSTVIDVETYNNLAFRTSNPVVTPTFSTQAPSYAAPLLTVNETTIRPNSIEYIGFDNAEIFEGNNIQIPSEALTDSYALTGKFVFYTTPCPFRRFDNGFWGGKDDHLPTDFGSFIFKVKEGNNVIKPNNLNLRVDYQQGVTSPTANPTTLSTGNIEIGRRYPNSTLAQYQNNALEIRFHSDIQRHALGFGGDFSKNRLDPNDGNRLKFTIDFTLPSGQLRPGQNISFTFESNVRQIAGKVLQNDIDTGEGRWHRSIFPPLPADAPDTAELDLTLLGTNTAHTEDINTVLAPYWSQDGVASNQIKLVSEHLNSRHASNYYQGTLAYTPSTNPIFPGAQEPSFTSFPGATDQFEILPGDEIRFQNNENESYTIRTVQPGNQLVLTLDRNLSSGLNLDFFVIRRYKPLANMIILDQQKPYTFPASASSSPGVLLPEFLVDGLETNPDNIITDLIERNLI